MPLKLERGPRRQIQIYKKITSFAHGHEASNGLREAKDDGGTCSRLLLYRRAPVFPNSGFLQADVICFKKVQDKESDGPHNCCVLAPSAWTFHKCRVGDADKNNVRRAEFGQARI